MLNARIHAAEIRSIRLVLAVSAFLVGASFCFGPDQWHASPSFYYVNLLHVSWYVFGAVFILAGICLVFDKVRPIGYLIGAIIYTFFSIVIWLTVLGGIHSSIGGLHIPSWLRTEGAGNLFAASNSSTVAVLYWAAVRWSVYEQVDPDRRRGVAQNE